MFLSVVAWSQLQTASSNQAVQSIVRQGWQVQSYQLSFDKQTLVFAGRQSGETRYNLFMADARGTQWVNVRPIFKDTPSDMDETWPTLSGDEQDIYFVRIKPAEGKNPAEYHIMRSKRQQDDWSTPERIVISDGEDISPLLLHDNQTLLFASRRVDAVHTNRTFALYFCRKISDHDWTTPELILSSDDKSVNYYAPEYLHQTKTLRYTKQIIQRHDTTYTLESLPLDSRYQPQATMTVQGVVRAEETGRGLVSEIKVFNAITSVPVATLHSAASGQFQLCLPVGNKYSVDITTSEHSHYYETFDCTHLTQDTMVECSVQLARQLSIRLHIYDSELLTPLRPDIIRAENAKIKYGDKHVDLILPIGNKYSIVTQKRGYTDDTLLIDTRKPVLLTESEMDIDLSPGKTTFTIHLADKDSLTGIMGQIELINRRTGERIVAQTSMRGAHNFQIRQGDDYDIHVNAAGYIFKDTTVSVPFSEKPIMQQVAMEQLHENMVMQLRNIQFELNSAALTAESYDELDKVIRMMRDNPEMRIELSAHTDDQGSDAYNDNLSSRRGTAVKRYLTEQGIASERVNAIGYGKRKPLVANDSDEHRAMNRRVEFIILDL